MHKIYCLNCKTGNAPERATCIACGMPLPTRLNLDEQFTSAYDELRIGENQTERIDLIEERIAGLTHSLEEVVNILQKLPSQITGDVAALKLESQAEADIESERESIDRIWNERIAGYLRFIENRDRYRRMSRQIKRHYHGDEPEKFERLLERSQIQFYSNRADRSMQLLERALRMSPENPELLYFIGERCFVLQQPERAVDVWRHVLELEPRHYRSALMAGIVEMLRGSLADARILLQEADNLAGGSSVALLTLATLELQDGNLEASARYVRSAHRLSETAYGHVILGEQFSRMGRPRNAVKELERASSLQPQDKAILLRLATLYLQSGYVRRAQDTFNRISSLSPKDEIYKALAKEKSRPELLAMAREREELNNTSILTHSVSELLRRELEH